jgi:hypothetical protein
MRQSLLGSIGIGVSWLRQCLQMVASRLTDANVKPLVLNKTNWSTIRRALGPPKNWPGAQIVLVAKSVEFGGEPTLGTRVKVPQKKPTTSVADDPNDEIPF